MRIPFAVLTLIWVLALPAIATAAPSTVGRDAATGALTFRSGSSPSDLVVDTTFDPFGYTVADYGNALMVGPGCDESTPVFCPFSGSLDVRLGEDSDRAKLVTYGGAPANMTAGRGDDTLQASPLRGVTRGGAGDDTIWANSFVGQIFGDGGSDNIYVSEDEMHVWGGDGNDLLVSSATLAFLEGGDGFDVLIAVGSREISQMDGGDDPDIIGFAPGVYSTSQLSGGGLYDSIHGSTGPEPVSAGAGNDEIWVHGGSADDVNCGAGFDVVYADADDSIARNCERIRLEPGPADPQFESALARAYELHARNPLFQVVQHKM